MIEFFLPGSRRLFTCPVRCLGAGRFPNSAILQLFFSYPLHPFLFKFIIKFCYLLAFKEMLVHGQ